MTLISFQADSGRPLQPPLLTLKRGKWMVVGFGPSASRAKELLSLFGWQRLAGLEGPVFCFAKDLDKRRMIC
jgi:hypothetical protein